MSFLRGKMPRIGIYRGGSKRKKTYSTALEAIDPKPPHIQRRDDMTSRACSRPPQG